MSSSSSSSASAAALETSSLLRLNGTELFSGLDTDGIIKKLTAGTRNKITVQKQLEQKAEWKRDEYRSIESMLEDFENTYFSYTSDTNFLSASFFEDTDITSSSDAVKATGSADDAANVTINDISQLASSASFSSTHEVSDEAITSGKIQDSWTTSNVGGKSLIVNYKGTDYTLTMSYSVQPDSENTTTEDGKTVVKSSEIQKVVDGLNDQINSNSMLKGKISFSYNTDNTISLNSADSSLVVLKPCTDNNNTSSYDAESVELLKSLGFSGGNQSGASITGSAVDKSVSTSGIFNKTISSDSYINVKYNGQNYTIKLGENLDIFNAHGDSKIIGDAIAKQINSQIKSDSSLKGLSSVAAVSGSDGTITFSSGVTVTGGSKNMIEGLFTSQTTNDVTTYTSAKPDSAALTKSYLGNTLAGSTVTFNLNGITKTITFKATEENQYSSADDIGTYLQGKLDKAFGSRTVTVDTTSDGELTFRTSDANSVLALSSSSDNINVLSSAGALRMNVGETNRTETSKTLGELKSELNTPLAAGSDNSYIVNVNGNDFTFTDDTTLGEVMSTINGSSDAGVTISYSQTLNTFRVIADDTGSQGKVSISDKSGNLAHVLFGVQSTDNVPLNNLSGLTAGTDGSYKVSLTDSVNNTTTQTFDGTENLSDVIKNIVNTVGAISDSNVQNVDGGGNLATILQNTTLSQISGLTAESDGKYKINFTYSDGNTASGEFDGTENLSDAINSIINNSDDSSGITNISTGDYTTASGKDLKMNVTLNGTMTNITRPSNNFTLDGLTLQVSDTYNYDTANDKVADISQKITFSSSNNTDDLYKDITDFVDAYNKIIKEVYTQVSESPERDKNHKIIYEPLTDDEKKGMSDSEIKEWNEKAKKGLLQNNDALNSILTDMDEAMSDVVSSVGMSLSQLGISTASTDVKSGSQLSVDSSMLKQALASEPEKVKELFTNSDGISQRVKKVLTKNISTSASNGDGVLILLAGKENFPNDQSEMTTLIHSYESRIDDLDDQLGTEEDRYWSQFTNMEVALSTLTAQSEYLSSMTGSSS